jgi:hypothetical protein
VLETQDDRHDESAEVLEVDHVDVSATRQKRSLVLLEVLDGLEDEVLQVAEGLRPAAVEEIAALREERAASPRVFDAVPDGHIVVADGESLTGKWRIVSDGRHDNIGALTIDRQWGAIAGTSTTTGDRIEPPLDLGADISDGTIVVWGVLWVDAATVAVESPGVEPVTLDIHDVEGWEHPVIAGSFPDDLFPVFAGEVVVVARDADGNEVGRNETVLGGD